jgi:hypothetical protein
VRCPVDEPGTLVVQEIMGGADATVRISRPLLGEMRKSDRAGRGWLTAQMRDRF